MPQQLFLMMKDMFKLFFFFFTAIAFSSLQLNRNALQLRQETTQSGLWWIYDSFLPPNFRTVVPWGDRHVTIIYPHATTRRISNWLKGQQAVSVCASATRRPLFSQPACSSRTLWGNLIPLQLQLPESSTDSESHSIVAAMTNRPNRPN